MTTIPVALVNMTAIGPHPQMTTCGACGNEGMTEVKPVNGTATWLAFGLLCFFGCWYGCCLIPFYWNSCKNVEHFCKKCNGYIGTYKRL